MIDVSGNDDKTLVLQFQRWLNVEDGYYDQARLLINDDVAWENHSTHQDIGDEHHEDQEWIAHTMVLPSGVTDQLTLGWEIESDGGLTMGGWTLDDICVYSWSEAVDDPSAGDGGAADSDMALQAGGCACASGGTTPTRPGGALAAFFLAGLALVRRRR